MADVPTFSELVAQADRVRQRTAELCSWHVRLLIERALILDRIEEIISHGRMSVYDTRGWSSRGVSAAARSNAALTHCESGIPLDRAAARSVLCNSSDMRIVTPAAQMICWEIVVTE